MRLPTPIFFEKYPSVKIQGESWENIENIVQSLESLTEVKTYMPGVTVEIIFKPDCDWTLLLQTLASIDEMDANIFTRSHRGAHRYNHVLYPNDIQQYLKKEQEKLLLKAAQENSPSFMQGKNQIYVMAIGIYWAVNLKKDTEGTGITLDEYSRSSAIINTTNTSNWKKLIETLANYEQRGVVRSSLAENNLRFPINLKTMHNAIALLSEQELSKIAGRSANKIKPKI